MMRSRAAIVLIGVLSAISSAHGQEATERFIPIGESPGLSSKHTMIGEIRNVDPQKRTLTVAAGGRTYDVVVTGHTRIWIDRSPLKLPALSGDFDDCHRGATVEVKLVEQGEKAADWIKVRATAAAREPSR